MTLSNRLEDAFGLASDAFDHGGPVDLRLELVTVPVSDIDRAKAFYTTRIGFNVEQDIQVDETHSFVELMPPGRAATSPIRTETAGRWTAR